MFPVSEKQYNVQTDDDILIQFLTSQMQMIFFPPSDHTSNHVGLAHLLHPHFDQPAAQ